MRTSESPSRSWNSPPLPYPALFTSTSTAGPRSAIAAIRLARLSASVTSQAIASARTPWSASSAASVLRRSSRRALTITPCPRRASSRAMSDPIPDDAPVTRQGEPGSGGGRATGARRPPRCTICCVSSEDPFGLFGDPDELRRRMAEFAEQMQGAQKVAWADNAIKLAVDMTVAAIARINLQGSAEQQAADLRLAMSRLFPEAVTLVREAREGFGTAS